MTPGLDPATVTTRTDDPTEVVDWASALAAAGIEHDTEKGVVWHRDPKRLAVREAEAGEIEVHGAILEDDPLVLVLVLLARDTSGTVTAAMLSGRPVAHAQGPMVGAHWVCTPEEFEQVVRTFERAVVARSEVEQSGGGVADHESESGEPPSAAPSS